MAKRTTLIAALAAVLSLGASQALAARTYLGFTVGISNAPPPPVITFRTAPRMVLVPDTRVYVVDDPRYDVGYDLFRSGGTWYVYDNGYWYRSTSYRGPYRVVDVRYVPRNVLRVPPGHWKGHPHGGPPGQMKKRGY